MANQVLYGFHDLGDLRDTRITPDQVPLINTAVEQAVAEHQRQADAIIGIFASKTTLHKTAYRILKNAKLQPLDEHGRARVIKALGGYDVGFPLSRGGIATGETYEESVLQTVGDVEQSTATMLLADINWLRDKILAALYYNQSWVYTDKRHGNITVQPLANGDETLYYTNTGTGSAAIAQHYNAQADDISDAHNPFPAIGQRLRRPVQNGKKIVSFVPTNLIGDVENLATFRDVADLNIQPGANTDVVIGTPGVELPGELKGYIKGAQTFIVQWDSLYDDRIVSVAIGGDQPLAMREHEEPTLQGFKLTGERSNYPYKERHFLHVAGFGGNNRQGADVTQIGNASYSVPDGVEEILKS